MKRWFCLLLVFAGCGPEGSPVAWDEEGYTQECPTQTIEGVDVYAGDGTIDWAKVKTSGRVFAFMKATQGDYNTQATFTANWKNSKTAGVIRSPYHFFDGTNDGVAQAHSFLNEIAQAGGLEDGDLPPMLDIECPTSSSQSAASANCEHTGDSGWVATATLTQRIFDWLDTVEQATGRKAIIYSYPSWFAGVGVTDARLKNYPLFIATYGSCASVPAPWTEAVFWQYSATGSISGINAANADHDRFVGTAGDLTAFIAGTIERDGGADLYSSADLTPAVDATPEPADLAEPRAEDAAVPDGGHQPKSASSGCQCQLGADRPEAGGAWLILVLVVGFAARRASAGRGRRSARRWS